jgi:AcrR family transcriptional regulator
MGRVAGVTAEETRQKLLSAAAAAFESQGFEGTRVADIASGAGVSNGALYSHFGSKTELLAAALHDKGHDELSALFLADPDNTAVDLLVFLGSHLIDRPRDDGALVIEALVAARRNGELARLMGDHLRERDEWLTGLISAAQDEGAIEDDIDAAVLSRFSLMLMLGSVLLPAADLPPVDPDAWTAFITRLGDAVRPSVDAEPPDVDLTREPRSRLTPGRTG